jgi:hypothetical protein
VLALLTHSETQVRLTACKVLLLIGTEDSLTPLEPLQDDVDPEVASYAVRAIEVIRERSKR